MNNHFANALLQNESTDFLLGRNKYFYLDRDRGIHDPTTTGMIIADYGNIVGCAEMNAQLNSTFLAALQNKSLTLTDIQTMLSIIFFWKSYREHRGDSMCEWEPTEEIKNALFISYERLRASGDVSVIESLIERLRSRFSWSN